MESNPLSLQSGSFDDAIPSVVPRYWNAYTILFDWFTYTIRPQKIQEYCICQIINRVGKGAGQKGYELETSKFLFLSSFCSASKITLFYVVKIMIFL